MSRRGLAYGMFCLGDHAVWLLVRLLPGPLLFRLIRQRPWRAFSPPVSESTRAYLLPRLRSLLAERCLLAGYGSSCLSRSLLARVLLDLIGVSNQLHLGMNRLPGRDRVPHAWLTVGERELSPGLDPGKGCRILLL
jgi:hypothetical protein